MQQVNIKYIIIIIIIKLSEKRVLKIKSFWSVCMQSWGNFLLIYLSMKDGWR